MTKKKKSLAEQAEEEGFNRRADEDAKLLHKTGMPRDWQAQEDVFNLNYERARDAGMRAKEDVKRGERTSPMGDISYKKGGKVSSASKRADGIAQRGKTKGRMV
jgi:hypothetical protein